MPTAKKTSPSTAVAKRAGGAVVSIQDQLKKMVANQAERLPSASGITIGVGQDKMFKFPDGTRADSFSGVVVDYVATNFYYEDAYDKDNIKPPACFAIGTLSNDRLIPSANSPAQQAASCAACPMNVFGSAMLMTVPSPIVSTKLANKATAAMTAVPMANPFVTALVVLPTVSRPSRISSVRPSKTPDISAMP